MYQRSDGDLYAITGRAALSLSIAIRLRRAPADDFRRDGRSTIGGHPVAVHPATKRGDQMGPAVIFAKKLDGFAGRGFGLGKFAEPLEAGSHLRPLKILQSRSGIR